MKLNGNTLKALGFPESKALGMVLKKANRELDEASYQALLTTLRAVLADPNGFEADPEWGGVAAALLAPVLPKGHYELRANADPYEVFGSEHIEAGAWRQIETAMRLPVAIGGALMPDAHQGYGLPIGGVLATENQVIPYGVGVDIGCRMCLSIYELPSSAVTSEKQRLVHLLNENTRFGRATFRQPRDHEVLTDPLFNEVQVLRELKDRAAAQIGSSGGGNHFVEFGVTELLDPKNEFGLPVGSYLSLLSHSGSRGFGANVANHYSRLARKLCTLPTEARHLAWLDLNTAEGQEYWAAMNLAGDYASACHHQIHDRMAESLGVAPSVRVENHHNFAWKEKDAKGRSRIVHRKGATPAAKGVLGVIPGSMTAPGFIVRGKGDARSINSAAHGAGRVMSRTQAKRELDPQQVAQELRKAGVEVIGSGLDEAPMAYKNIETVMASQADLVEVVGTFLP
ncbi:MAG: RtcB family protein [Salibacteraceae bacterium]